MPPKGAFPLGVIHIMWHISAKVAAGIAMQHRYSPIDGLSFRLGRRAYMAKVKIAPEMVFERHEKISAHADPIQPTD